MTDPKDLYGESYFRRRKDDPLRARAYEIDHRNIEQLRPVGGRIFDVGCGNGAFLDRFDPTKWERFGMDVSEKAIAEARSHGLTIKPYSEGYDYPDAHFDVVVFRGTIQHIDTPFAAIKRCAALLKPGGLMAFLATPNANSWYYRHYGTLPFLDPKLNFYIPSDTTLPNILENFGMRVREIRYPYLETPYARPWRDFSLYLISHLGLRFKFPFPGNIIEVYAEKP